MWWEGGKKHLQQYRHRCAVADHIHSETGTVTVLVSKKRTEKTERVTIIYRWRTSQALSTSSDNASWGLLLTNKATRFWRRDSALSSPISLTLMSSPHLRLQVSLCFHSIFLLIICFSSAYSLVITHFNEFLLLLFIRVSLCSQGARGRGRIEVIDSYCQDLSWRLSSRQARCRTTYYCSHFALLCRTCIPVSALPTLLLVFPFLFWIPSCFICGFRVLSSITLCLKN